MFVSTVLYRKNKASCISVVLVQLKTKTGFGVGMWLFPSLNPSMLGENLKSSGSCQKSHLVCNRIKSKMRDYSIVCNLIML